MNCSLLNVQRSESMNRQVNYGVRYSSAEVVTSREAAVTWDSMGHHSRPFHSVISALLAVAVLKGSQIPRPASDCLHQGSFSGVVCRSNFRRPIVLPVRKLGLLVAEVQTNLSG
jgi:hypothetical protein